MGKLRDPFKNENITQIHKKTKPTNNLIKLILCPNQNIYLFGFTGSLLSNNVPTLLMEMNSQ